MPKKHLLWIVKHFVSECPALFIALHCVSHVRLGSSGGKCFFNTIIKKSGTMVKIRLVMCFHAPATTGICSSATFVVCFIFLRDFCANCCTSEPLWTTGYFIIFICYLIILIGLAHYECCSVIGPMLFNSTRHVCQSKFFICELFLFSA